MHSRTDKCFATCRLNERRLMQKFTLTIFFNFAKVGICVTMLPTIVENLVLALWRGNLASFLKRNLYFLNNFVSNRIRFFGATLLSVSWFAKNLNSFFKRIRRNQLKKKERHPLLTIPSRRKTKPLLLSLSRVLLKFLWKWKRQLLIYQLSHMI